MSTGFRRTAAHPATDSGRADGVVERTIRSLESGMSVGEVARASNLPRDFIEQIAVFARERGRLDFVSLSADTSVFGNLAGSHCRNQRKSAARSFSD